MPATTHRGPWVDKAPEAMPAALAEVNLDQFAYLTVEYSNGFRLVRITDDEPVVDVEVIYSEPRQQYRAVLRKL